MSAPGTPLDEQDILSRIELSGFPTQRQGLMLVNTSCAGRISRLLGEANTVLIGESNIGVERPHEPAPQTILPEAA